MALPASSRARPHRPGQALRRQGQGQEEGARGRLAKDLRPAARLRSDTGAGRTEERINEWTDRATGLYRRAIRTREQGDDRRAREYGTAAHDLARAVDHARNASRFDRPDPELPPPPDGFGPEEIGERTRRDLYRAYERIGAADAYRSDADAKFYFDAARDLYNAARRDAEAGREERAGELARAAEAMTHVPEHLTARPRAGRPPRRPPNRVSSRPDPKEKGRGPRPR